MSQEGIADAAEGITPEGVQRACRPFKYPCKFDDTNHEISFMVIMRMLEFGSGYNHLIAEKGQKSAKDVIQVRGLCVLRSSTACSCPLRTPDPAAVRSIGILSLIHI